MTQIVSPMLHRLAWLSVIVAIFAKMDSNDMYAGDTDADRILQRAIDAAGGQKNLERLKGPIMWMERGTFHGMGQPAPFVGQYSSKWPNWYREEIENAFVITTSGDQAWVHSPTGEQLLEGDQRDERLMQSRVVWIHRLFPLTGEGYTLTKIDGIEVEGKPTDGIQASHADHRDVKLYFDKSSALLVKTETMLVSPQHGPEPILSETYYQEHKPFGTAKMPSKTSLHYDGKLFVESATVDFKTGATLDPNLFEPPK